VYSAWERLVMLVAEGFRLLAVPLAAITGILMHCEQPAQNWHGQGESDSN